MEDKCCPNVNYGSALCQPTKNNFISPKVCKGKQQQGLQAHIEDTKTDWFNL